MVWMITGGGGGGKQWLTDRLHANTPLSVELCRKKSLRGYILNMWRIMMQQPEHPGKMIIYGHFVFFTFIKLEKDSV